MLMRLPFLGQRLLRGLVSSDTGGIGSPKPGVHSTFSNSKMAKAWAATTWGISLCVLEKAGLQGCNSTYLGFLCTQLSRTAFCVLLRKKKNELFMSRRIPFAVLHPASPRVFVEIKTIAPLLQRETYLIGEPRIVVAFFSPPYSVLVGLRKSAKSSEAKREPHLLKPSPWWPDACCRRDRVLTLPHLPTGARMEVVPGGLLRLLNSCWRESFPRASWKT